MLQILETMKECSLVPSLFFACGGEKEFGQRPIPFMFRAVCNAMSFKMYYATLQLPSLHWSPFIAVMTSFSWSNLIRAPPMWHLEQK